MLMHERFFEFLKSHEGVEFVKAEDICEEYALCSRGYDID